MKIRLVVIGFLLFSCVSQVDRDLAFYQNEAVPIMGKASMSRGNFLAYVKTRNPELNAERLVRIFEAYQVETRAEDVNLYVALAQMLHETNYLKFDGTVKPEQNNFAGLGTVSKTEPGLFFDSIEVGVRAHIQHLKAYGSVEVLSKDLVDPRFKYVKRGSATTIDGLTGRWAADPQYGQKLRVHIIRLLEAQKHAQVS